MTVTAAALKPSDRLMADGVHYAPTTFPQVVGLDGVGRLADGTRVAFLPPQRPARRAGSPRSWPSVTARTSSPPGATSASSTSSWPVERTPRSGSIAPHDELVAAIAAEGPYDLIVDYLWGAPAEATFAALGDAAAYDDLLQQVAAGEIVVDLDPVPLADVEHAWPKAGSDRRIVFVP